LKGLYTELSALISAKEDKGKIVMDARRLTEQIQDLINLDKSMTIGELKDAYAKAAVQCSLYQHGYKSILRGEGLFVKVDVATNKNVLKKLYNNANESVRQKASALEKIFKRLKVVNGCEGQLTFDEKGNVTEEENIAELIDRIREEERREEAEA
jgi:hypothetical protein